MGKLQFSESEKSLDEREGGKLKRGELRHTISGTYVHGGIPKGNEAGLH